MHNAVNNMHYISIAVSFFGMQNQKLYKKQLTISLLNETLSAYLVWFIE